MSDSDNDDRSPRLGYATTRELLQEIEARIRGDEARGGGGLDYRTVRKPTATAQRLALAEAQALAAIDAIETASDRGPTGAGGIR